jgi:hypothetical protein
MNNKLLAHAIITHQHSGGGTMLAGAYVTRQHKCTILAGALCRPPALCLCKINNPFLKQ